MVCVGLFYWGTLFVQDFLYGRFYTHKVRPIDSTKAIQVEKPLPLTKLTRGLFLAIIFVKRATICSANCVSSNVLLVTAIDCWSVDLFLLSISIPKVHSCLFVISELYLQSLPSVPLFFLIFYTQKLMTIAVFACYIQHISMVNALLPLYGKQNNMPHRFYGHLVTLRHCHCLLVLYYCVTTNTNFTVVKAIVGTSPYCCLQLTLGPRDGYKYAFLMRAICRLPWTTVILW